jgi:hypothetical protein
MRAGTAALISATARPKFPSVTTLTPNQRSHNVVCGRSYCWRFSTLPEEFMQLVGYCVLVCTSALVAVTRPCLYYYRGVSLEKNRAPLPYFDEFNLTI